MIVHNVAEIAGDIGRRVKARRACWPRAKGLRLIAIPRAHLSPRPLRTMRPDSAKHLGMMTVRGHFAELTATGEIDVEHPENSKIEATINVASIRTHNAQRDKAARVARNAG